MTKHNVILYREIKSSYGRLIIRGFNQSDAKDELAKVYSVSFNELERILGIELPQPRMKS